MVKHYCVPFFLFIHSIQHYFFYYYITTGQIIVLQQEEKRLQVERRKIQTCCSLHLHCTIRVVCGNVRTLFF
jgi:hypothetical protein